VRAAPRRAIVIGVGAASSIVLLALACGDSLEVNPNDPNNAPEGGVGVNPDAALPPSPALDGAPLDPEPDDPPLEELPDAGCLDASFLEDFSPQSAATFKAIEEGGTQMAVGDGFLAATANNRSGAASYVRRSLCNAPPAVTCVMRIRVNELIAGQLSLFELRGIDNGKAVTIRVKTNQTQITGRPDPVPNQLMPGLQTFTNITITARKGEVQIEPGGVKYDAGLANMRFTEIQSGIVYLTRSDFDAARASITVDSIACQFSP
jgi:hypothetical protein